MARAFKCKECGTGYSTTGNGAPPSPRWDDGHVCEMVEVESKISPLKSRQSGKSYMNSMTVLKKHLYGFRKFSRCQSIKKIFNI